MRIAIIVLLGSLLLSCTQEKVSQKELITSSAQEAKAESNHDTAHIAGLNTDDYGVYKYVMVLLKQGPNWDQDSTEATRLQRAHMDNVAEWERENLLAVAEPSYNDTSEVQGIYVFALENAAEVDKLVSLDPAVQAGRFVADSYLWENSSPVKDVNFILQLLSQQNK